MAHGAHAQSSIHILTASPSSEWVLRGRGISGGIPNVYGEALRHFYVAAEKAQRLMHEWRRIQLTDTNAKEAMTSFHKVAVVQESRSMSTRVSGWTFHGKGLWLLRKEGLRLAPSL